MAVAYCKIDFMHSPGGADANLETAVRIATGLSGFIFFQQIAIEAVVLCFAAD
jgi:hypothetical protein